jgi:hypothetical protein
MQLVKLSKVEGQHINEDEVSVETTKPVIINVSSIRCFYARRGDAVGTRITFTDGGGFAVKESVDEILGLCGEERLASVLQIADARAN